MDDVTDASSLEHVLHTLGATLGAISRYFGAHEQLQQPLAIVRERLGIPGFSGAAAHNFRDKARMKGCVAGGGGGGRATSADCLPR